jgi:hypothetical protein
MVAFLWITRRTIMFGNNKKSELYQKKFLFINCFTVLLLRSIAVYIKSNYQTIFMRIS